MEIYTIRDLMSLTKSSRRTIFNWLDWGIIPKQAVLGRLGKGSKIRIDGRVIRHMRTNDMKQQMLQKILQQAYESNKTSEVSNVG